MLHGTIVQFACGELIHFAPVLMLLSLDAHQSEDEFFVTNVTL